jgi:hypothetical protein
MGFVTETRAHIQACRDGVDASQDLYAVEEAHARLAHVRTRIFQRRVVNMDLLDEVNDALQIAQSRMDGLRTLQRFSPAAPFTPLCLRATSAISGAFLLTAYMYAVLRYYGTV